MGLRPRDRSPLRKVVGAFGRFARWVAGAESSPGPNARRGKKRSHGFKDRRDRRKNIETTLQCWREPPARASNERGAAEAPPYQRTPRLLTEGEYAFWVPLYHAVKGRYRVFCKVRLADVIQCPAERGDERRWFRKIGNYHVDFVICNPATTRPLLVIELDDRSHRIGDPRRNEIDLWKDEALRAAQMPVYRVAAGVAYDVQGLDQAIERMIGNSEQ
jgi:hypothetical protein